MASIQETAGQVTPSVPNLGRVWADRPDTPETIQEYDDAIGDDYLQSIAHALRDQATATSSFTPASLFPRDANNQPFLSWRVYLLPYLGYQSLFEQFKLDEAWDSANNLPLLDQMPDVYRVPGSDPTTNTTRLRWLAGDGAPFTPFQATGASIGLSQFQDGLDTILFVEAGSDRAVNWTQPDALSFNAADPWISLGQFAREPHASRPRRRKSCFAADLLTYFRYSFARDLQWARRTRQRKPCSAMRRALPSANPLASRN